MKQIIKMQDLPPEKRTQLMRILDRNRVKKLNRKAKLSKINLRSTSFGVSDYLKYINDKLKR
jgi:hypothetical protein